MLTRAHELARRSDSPQSRLTALMSLSRLRCTRAELSDALALGEEFVKSVDGAPDPLPLIAESFMASVRYFRGELEMATAHADRGVALHDVARHGALARGGWDDPGVLCLGLGARALWGLGYAQRADAQARAAVALARRIELPHCESIALNFQSWVNLYARNITGASASLDVYDALAIHHGFPAWLAQGAALRGWLLLQQERDLSTAIELLERGLAARVASGVLIGRPWLMAILAQALATAGQGSRARELVDEATAVTSSTGELVDRMHALTVKGDLCARESDDREAAACFEEASRLHGGSPRE